MPLETNLATALRQKIGAHCRCNSAEWWLNGLFGFVPIFSWLPKYNFRRDILNDIIAGLTIGIMHIPQGRRLFQIAKSNDRTVSWSILYWDDSYTCNTNNSQFLAKPWKASENRRFLLWTRTYLWSLCPLCLSVFPEHYLCEYYNGLTWSTAHSKAYRL